MTKPTHYRRLSAYGLARLQAAAVSRTWGEIAETLEVSRQTLSGYLHGKSIGPRNALTIVDLYGRDAIEWAGRLPDSAETLPGNTIAGCNKPGL
jgi:predicted transcriptional regulator